jgi:hypothetical protein
MGEVGCVGRDLERVWAGVSACTGKCGGHILLWLNSRLMCKIYVCVKFIAMLVYNIEGYSVMLVTS